MVSNLLQIVNVSLLSGVFPQFQKTAVIKQPKQEQQRLVKVFNDIHLNTDSGRISVLVLLDLSAAFNTVDHNILLDWLENRVGRSHTVLNWLNTT